MSSKRQMLMQSFTVAFFSLLGGLTGILVDTGIAAKLGLSQSSDTFYVAYTVPYIITNLLYATGQFSLVPFFSFLDARHSEDDLWHGFSYAVTMVLTGMAAITVVGVLGSPLLIRGIAPGLTRAQTDLAVQVCRWLFIIIIPAGVAEVFRSFLLSQNRFALASAAGFIRNTVVVIFILAGYKAYGLYSIVLGFATGYALQLGVLAAQVLTSFKVRYTPTLQGQGVAFRNLRGAGSSQLATALGWQGVVIVERIIASFLPAGTLTALNYGFKIMSTMAELLVGSLGTAVLPKLSRVVATAEPQAERRTFQETLEIGLMTIIPATIFCVMLPHNIIRLVFERGRFTTEATELMSMVFFYYCLSLICFSFTRILNFYLFARQEVWAFFRVAAFQYASTVLLDLVLVFGLHLGARGIPLSMFVSTLLTCSFAVVLNVAGLRTVFDRTLGVITSKNAVGGLLAALTIWELRRLLRAPSTGSDNFLLLCMLCGAGLLVFMLTLAATGAMRLSSFRAGRES